MKNSLKLWIRLGCLAALVLLGLGAALLPAVFSADVVSAVLRILEVVARLS